MSEPKPRRRRAADDPRPSAARVRRKSHTLDVRPMLARGEEPFRLILETAASVGPGESFTLLTPFLPAPLIGRLQMEGFVVQPERRLDGSWQTQFSRPP